VPGCLGQHRLAVLPVAPAPLRGSAYDRRVERRTIEKVLIVVWLAMWAPAYLFGWGWRNFLNLCDLAVVLTCVAIWRSDALLLSMQALATVLIGLLWTVDLAARLATGRDLFGWTAYMFDAGAPLPLRLLSLFHIALPVVILLGLRRTGYDRRALWAQSALAACVLAASRLFTNGKNLNFVLTDPVWKRTFGPPPLHVAVILVVMVAALYVPTHLVLRRTLRPARAAA